MTKRHGEIFSTITALLAGFFILIAPGAFAQTGTYIDIKNIDRADLDKAYAVTARALNFRSDPSLDSVRVSVVQQGDFLLQTDNVFNQEEGIQWMKVIRADGLEGWVSARHVQPVADALATVENAAAFLAGLDASPAAPLLPALEPNEELRVGFIYPATVGDAGWSFSHDAGRREMEELPFVKETSYIESVPEDPELVTDAIEQLVAEGKNLIFTASYGYMDPTMEAAKRHPDVVFMHNSGFKTQPNAGTYFGRIYQARYLAGIVAGSMTESNKIGFVAAFPIPEVIRGINAFTLGAQSVNPNVTVDVEWTSTWYGPGIEREKAEALLDQGADVITIHQDSPAALQAAAQRGVYGIGFHSDMSAFGPDTILTSAIWDWGVLYKQIAFEMREGVWDPEQVWWGLDKGVVGLAPLSDKVPLAVAALVEQRRDEIAAGKLRVFEGPIRDTAGDIRAPSGAILSDADLLTMDYYVLGVEGGIPPAITTVSDESEAS